MTRQAACLWGGLPYRRKFRILCALPFLEIWSRLPACEEFVQKLSVYFCLFLRLGRVAGLWAARCRGVKVDCRAGLWWLLSRQALPSRSRGAARLTA